MHQGEARATQLGVSAEDKYAVLDMHSPDLLFPHTFTFGNLAGAIAKCGDRWEFMWDFRRNGNVLYGDIVDAYEEAEWALSMRDRRIIASEGNADSLSSLASRNDAELLVMREKYLPVHKLDLEHFDEDFFELLDWASIVPEFMGNVDRDAYSDLGFIREPAEFDDYLESVVADINMSDYLPDELVYNQLASERSRVLTRFLDTIATNSLLTEVALVSTGNRITVVPYHSHSLHGVASEKRDETVIMQPGVISSAYWQRFRSDIDRLEHLVNLPRVKEAQIEELLRRNPLFLRGLNYTEAHYQVVFPRTGADDLRPDIVAKPANSDWWEIIDLKLPRFPVLVGTDNRPSLSAAITEAASQLREYAAYFENRDFAKRIEQKYGFKCYKPKLVVIVGRDPKRFSLEEQRRAMTAYPSLEIVTYDKLIESARSHLLL